MTEAFFSGPKPGGAGTAITALDQSVNTQRQERGAVVFIGPTKKGLPNQVVAHTDEASVGRRTGRPSDSDYLGEAVLGALRQAQGAGSMSTYRIVPNTVLGTPTGKLRLYDRNPDAGYHLTVAGARLRSAVVSCDAASAGDWAGPAYYFGGSVSDDSAAISGQDFDAGLALWAEDELVGASFQLDGHDRTYKVLGNTAAGVLSLDGGFTTYTTTGGATKFRVFRENTDANGSPMELSIVVGDDPTQPLNLFAMTPVIDRKASIKSFKRLDLTDSTAIEEEVEGELSSGGPNEELSLDFSVSEVADESLPESRPCNWAGVPVPKTISTEADLGLPTVANSKTVTFKIFDFVRTTGSGSNRADIARSSVSYPAGAVLMPIRLVLTFTSSTAFTVAATDLNGKQIAAGLPNGAKGTPYASPHPHIPNFTVASTGTAATGNVYTLEFRPFPADLIQRGARLYVSAFASAGDGSLDPTKGYQVIGATADTLTLATDDDLEAEFQAPQPPAAVGGTAGPYNLTGGGKTFKYTVTVGGFAESEVTLTSSLSGGSTSAAALADDLNTQDAGGNNEMYFYVGAGDKLAWVFNRGDCGADVSIVCGTSDIKTLAGFTGPYTGSDGAPARLEYAEPLRNARPGDQGITNLDYTSGPLAVSDNNPLLQWIRSHTGLVHLVLPGVITAALHQAALDFCQAVGAMAILDLPDGDTIATEEAAVKWVRDNVDPKRYGHYQWPSWGYTTGGVVTPNKLRKIPLSGDVAGAMVRYANRRDSNGRGWHKAPGGAGHVVLSPRISRLDTGAANGTAPKQIRDHVLNNGGILPIVRNGAAIYVHGDEGTNPSFLGTYWVHKQKAFLDIITTLRTQFADLEYERNPSDGGTLKFAMDLKVGGILKTFFADGALDVLEDGLPLKLENTYTFDAGPSLNPASVRNQGRRVGNLRFSLVNVAKVIEINIFTDGISVSPMSA